MAHTSRMSSNPGTRPFVIAQISDLHCGGPHFLPNLLDRAVNEVNDLEPDIVVVSGDLTTFGFKEEYAQANSYLSRIACPNVVVIPGNHDSRNVGYVHFEELFGPRNSVLRVGSLTVVAVDSTEPDLDNGQIGRGRYGWIEEQFGEPADLRVFVLHHHLLPVPGTGRERNIVNDAGGTDKLRGTPDYGVPLVEEGPDVDVAIDLTDERRPELVAAFLAAGIPYVGADFRFDPPPFHPFELPSIAVIGTGKRVGKTAVSTHVARLLARDRSVVCVAMGRGGPAEPELVRKPPTIDELVARSRAGRHAASDFLELACLAGVPAVGCRRAGGGLAGAPFVSNVLEGARLAASLQP